MKAQTRKTVKITAYEPENLHQKFRIVYIIPLYPHPVRFIKVPAYFFVESITVGFRQFSKDHKVPFWNERKYLARYFILIAIENANRKNNTQ